MHRRRSNTPVHRCPSGAWPASTWTGSSQPVDGTKTGWELEHGRPFQGTLVPFGCAVTYHDPDADKPAVRGIPGMAVGYGPDGSLKVMDLARYTVN